MLAEQIIVDILREELSLPQNNVWIRDQNRKIPIDDDLYVIVGMVDSTVMGNVNTIIPSEGGMTEIQEVTTRENIQIDILSRSTEAITRRFEIITALKSFLSTQSQEENEFKIFAVPTTFVNSSSAEGGSNINRFTIIVGCHTLFRKEKVLESVSGDYFDEFETRVDDENTIEEEDGLFEFTIYPESTA